MQMLGVALSQFDDRVDPGPLQQVTVLLADPANPHEVGPVDPIKDEFVADASGLPDLLSPLRGCPGR